MSAFLSQVVVEKREALRVGLRDSYGWHRALWSVFPDREGEARDFLFRLSDLRDRFGLLLLSRERPLLPEWGAWQTKQVAETFLSHDRYLFQLRANPTVKRVVRDKEGERKKNGRRTAIYDAQELQEWLGRKADQAGFNLLEHTAGPPLSTFFVKDGRRGKHTSVDFKGLLEVADRERFQRAFHEGIGSAKAFGFGLLMLQPVE
jgi:CRISPR system Cascade subunit CasE